MHCIPVGNAGNITAYWKGYREYAADGVVDAAPRMFGFQAAGAAPIVNGAPVLQPLTIATAIRIGNPASWTLAEQARDESGGLIDAVTDKQILEAYRLIARSEAVFVEPASAASVAGLLMTARDGRHPARLDGRLHSHRQRAQGPRVGDLRSAEADHRARRRARRGGPARTRMIEQGPWGTGAERAADERGPRENVKRSCGVHVRLREEVVQ